MRWPKLRRPRPSTSIIRPAGVAHHLRAFTSSFDTAFNNAGKKRPTHEYYDQSHRVLCCSLNGVFSPRVQPERPRILTLFTPVSERVSVWPRSPIAG